MATDIGANIVQNDLIFGFDSGYGVADNSTATRFYPGEPTVNYVSDSPSQGGWSGGIDVLDSSQKKFKCHISNFSANPGAGWRSFTWNMNDHSGSDVTISLDFETVGPNGTMAWIMVGQTNTHTGNNSGAGQYMGYSATSEKTTKSTTSKERVTWTGTVGSTGTASQPSGHIGFTIWINNGVPGNQDAYVIVSNVQIEKKDHATPFVNGTRSNTAGLIDLKRTTDIDVSNASFDSTGQPTFDGTDDIIELNRLIDTSNYSAEFVFKADVNTSGTEHWLGSQYPGTGRVIFDLWTNNALRNFINGTAIYGSTTISTGVWYHAVFTRNSAGTAYIYLNGVEDATGTISTATPVNHNFEIGASTTLTRGFTGEIPVVKIYDRALSADEVQQNYNAYKKRFDL